MKESVRQRLEELRVELQAERISTGELLELQSLAKYISPDDVELLEAAGVPEHKDPAEQALWVLTGKTEPLIRQARKAYLQTEVAKLEKLLNEQTFWRRRQTIARNKLGEVRDKIDELAMELAQATIKKEP